MELGKIYLPNQKITDMESNKYTNCYYRLALLLAIIGAITCIWAPNIAIYFAIAFLCIVGLPLGLALIIWFVCLVIGAIVKMKGHQDD